jgi:hypothetical protein
MGTTTTTMAIRRDRYVTPYFHWDPRYESVGVHVPALDNDTIISLEVSTKPHTYNYPALDVDYATNKIVCEFDFDDVDGTTITDNVSGQVATEQGDPTYQVSGTTTKGLGKGITYDGTDDQHDIAYTEKQWDITTDDFSIEIVCNLTSGSNGSKTLMEQREASNGIGWSIYFGAAEQLTACIEDSTGEVTAGGDTDVASSTIRHIAVTADRDGNLTTYVDGAADSTTGDISGNTGNLKAAGNFSIGGDSDGAGNITGTIYFARVYKGKCLTAAEVLDNYNTLMGTSIPGWVKVIDPTDGKKVVLATEGTDPCYINLSRFYNQLKGKYIRIALDERQSTTPAELKFIWDHE